MRLRFVAEVEGSIHLESDFRFTNGVFEYEFLCDVAGNLTQLAVSTNVPRDRIQQFQLVLKEPTDTSHAVFGFGGDAELSHQLIQRIQVVESNLGFLTKGALKRIRWDQPQIEPIPETEEERETVTLPAYSVSQGYSTDPVSVERAALELTTDDIFEPLRTVQAFWRQGVRAFEESAFVVGFYNFYFVIEGLYADGNWKERGVLTAFSRSSDFCSICGETLQLFEGMGRHWENLRAQFRDQKCDLDVDGLQKFLFRVRGKLHHYTEKGSQIRGTPFNQRAFESAAYLILELSGKAIARERERLKS